MLKCAGLFMSLPLSRLGHREEAAVEMTVSSYLLQANVCDSGVQHQRTEVPAGRAGRAPVWLRGLPQEDGGRRGEHFSRPGNASHLYSSWFQI